MTGVFLFFDTIRKSVKFPPKEPPLLECKVQYNELLYSSTMSKGPPHQKTSAYMPRLLNYRYLKTDMDFLHMFNLKMTVKKINFGEKLLEFYCYSLN